jgi:hypothetical protein
LWSFRYQGRHLAGENRDVPSGALQNTDAATKRVRVDLCLGRGIDHRWDNAFLSCFTLFMIASP